MIGFFKKIDRFIFPFDTRYQRIGTIGSFYIDHIVDIVYDLLAQFANQPFKKRKTKRRYPQVYIYYIIFPEPEQVAYPFKITHAGIKHFMEQMTLLINDLPETHADKMALLDHKAILF